MSNELQNSTETVFISLILAMCKNLIDQFYTYWTGKGPFWATDMHIRDDYKVQVQNQEIHDKPAQKLIWLKKSHKMCDKNVSFSKINTYVGYGKIKNICWGGEYFLDFQNFVVNFWLQLLFLIKQL